MKSRPKNFSFFVLGVLVLSNIFAWIVVWDLNKTKGLDVIFFDVGQGDAIFIVSPKGQQILIDGGPDSTILEKLATEMPFWDRTIDLIILSHPEADHLVGLIEVLKRYKVENIFWTGVIRDTSEYKEWTEAIEKEKANIKIAKAGQKISMRMRPYELYFDILYPFEELAGEALKDSNNTSIVLRLVFDENSFFFTGDAYKSVEEKIIQRFEKLDSNFLKVGHHGSRTSTSEDFLKKISSEIAVISVAKNNRYGHPHQEVLERLEKFDIKVLRTDEIGDIKIISDGKNLRIK